MWHSVDHKKSTFWTSSNLFLVLNDKKQSWLTGLQLGACTSDHSNFSQFWAGLHVTIHAWRVYYTIVYCILYIVYSILYYTHTHTHTHTQYNILYYTSWTVVCQAPLSMGFSRQEYWRISLTQGSNPGLLHCRLFAIWATREAHKWWGSTIFAFPCGCFSSSSLVSSEILTQNLRM